MINIHEGNNAVHSIFSSKAVPIVVELYDLGFDFVPLLLEPITNDLINVLGSFSLISERFPGKFFPSDDSLLAGFKFFRSQTFNILSVFFQGFMFDEF